MTEPRVAAGHILALRLFDLAYAIDLGRAEAQWMRHAAGSASRSRLSGTPTKAMAFGVPPLSIALTPLMLDVEGVPMEAGVSARLYEFGVVSLALRLPVADMAWPAFAALLDGVGRLVASDVGAMLWRSRLDPMLAVLTASLDRPLAAPLEEDYLIGVAREFDTKLTTAQLLDSVDLVPLLSGESRALSEAARADLLRQRFSYYTDDLVVLTWDRAFVYEPRGDSDVADVIEVANAQLLEMRYYDELLDDELPRMYAQVETARRSLALLSARRYAGLARRFYGLVAEVTELTEKVDNALQVTEDVYLARIYSAALDLFRVATVSAAVDRKLAIIRDTYAALYDEASSARSELMEAAILLLIAVELILALVRP